MAAVTTIGRPRTSVIGSARRSNYQITINNSGDTLRVPFRTVLDAVYVGQTSDSVGITHVLTPAVSGTVLTFFPATVPTTGDLLVFGY